MASLIVAVPVLRKMSPAVGFDSTTVKLSSPSTAASASVALLKNFLYVPALNRSVLLTGPTMSVPGVVRDPPVAVPSTRVTVIDMSAGAGWLSVIANVLWFVLAGWWLALAHLVTGILLCLTIVGIPLGVADFKMAGAALVPFGKEIVRTTDLAQPPPGAIQVSGSR